MRGVVALAAPILMLAGCGAGEPAAQADAAATASQSGEPGAQAAAAKKSDCARVRPQAAPAGQPADDVLGLRVGMSLEDARKILACANPIYAFSEQQGQWYRNGKPPMRRVVLQADGGLDDVTVDFAGPEGAERAVRLVRTMEYAQGSERPFDLIKSTIEKKYGALDTLEGYGTSAGAAVYAVDGQRLGAANTDYSQCIRNAGDYATSSPTLSNCGLVVKYRIQPAQGDEALARSFNVVVFDAGKALRLMDQIETARRDEVMEQARPGDAPKI
jgi:hypothetical protein